MDRQELEILEGDDLLQRIRNNRYQREQIIDAKKHREGRTRAPSEHYKIFEKIVKHQKT